MKVEIHKALQPLRKLREVLKDFPAHPSPEDVHTLRTRSRRLEAIVHALSPADAPAARRLLKLVKPVRKAAGDVRDMDVLIANLFALSDQPAAEGMVRLTEHLAGLRNRRAAHLRRVLRRRSTEARKSLKSYIRSFEQSETGPATEALAVPQILAAQLEHWPQLNARNLHEFRIQGKELRYILQLTPVADQRQLDAFGQMKDAAGEWHDWTELRKMAEEVLDPAGDRDLLRQIAAVTREKLRLGLAAANRLRKRGIQLPEAA
ncbi:MAG TPA: CHAD domain-containing protein [Terracidiphilus sp.]|jgi:CHAD domain-containing protein|nr:CHAD domain-containing protein [Terracidiphilus sp.]